MCAFLTAMADPTRRRRRSRSHDEARPTEDYGIRMPRLMMRRKTVCALVLAAISVIAIAITLIYSLGSTNENGLQYSELSAYERGLVTTDVEYRDILLTAKQPWENVDHRNLSSSVLGYVTPWNSKGYDMAKRHRSKFTHISPVWYQLRRDHKSLELRGQHDVDQRWISAVRKRGSPLIVPRVVIEGWALGVSMMLSTEKHDAISLITTECRNQGFDGIVLEAWSPWAAYGVLQNPELRPKAIGFIKDLALALHKLKSSDGQPLVLILVIPPPSNDGSALQFGHSELTVLKEAVDAFSLMTYDFSHANSPGPSAPLLWIRECLQTLLPQKRSVAVSSKILMGINFYGNDFILPRGGGPILGDDYLRLLRRHKPKIIWEPIDREHYFDYADEGKKHRVFYPTLKYLDIRLAESQLFEVGISIWELGQGLEYFFDLL